MGYRFDAYDTDSATPNAGQPGWLFQFSLGGR